MTKRKFCLKNNLDSQAFRRFVELGLIQVETIQKNGCVRINVNPTEVNNLVENKHYVVCEYCGKKAIVLSDRHYNRCPGNPAGASYKSSELYAEEKKKTEEQKEKQSLKLKMRFQTAEGVTTKEVISRASKKYNSKPEVRVKKSQIMQRRYQNPQQREKTRLESIERWSDVAFRRKMRRYVEENIDQLRESAYRARQYVKGKFSSKLHLDFKSKMKSAGISGFETEQPIKFYWIDELNKSLRIALEIDGCYWHGCSVCGYEGFPVTTRISKSKETYLRNRGWSVLRLKEHEIKSDEESCLNRIKKLVRERERLL